MDESLKRISKRAYQPFFCRLVFLAFCFFSFSCQKSPKRNFYPETLKGKQVAFYNQQGAVCDQDALYHFKSDESFRCNHHGDFFVTGHYQYRCRACTNQAHLSLDYQDGPFTHHGEMRLSYDSAYEGHWQVVKTTDPLLKETSSGTFRFIN